MWEETGGERDDGIHNYFEVVEYWRYWRTVEHIQRTMDDLEAGAQPGLSWAVAWLRVEWAGETSQDGC